MNRAGQLLIITLALGSVACVPGYTVTQGGEPVSITGRLAGELQDGVECLWITGSTGEQTHLLWFDEAAVRTDPLRFVDPAGSVIARPGDIITVTGPSGGIGETICAPGEPTFMVDRVVGPGGEGRSSFRLLALRKSMEDSPPEQRHRRVTLGRRSAAISLLAASLLVACDADFGGPSHSVGEARDCRSFGGETVEAVAWSTTGDFLAVSTSSDSDGHGRIRVFQWPEMEVVSNAITDPSGVDDVPIAGDGTVYWFFWDPFTSDAASAQLWSVKPHGTPAVIGGPMAVGPHTGLVWSGGDLVTMETDVGPIERSRLVKIDLDQPDAEPQPLTPWNTRIWSTFWADRAGEWLVWDEYDDAGEPQDFVVLHAGERKVVRPPGYGGRQMSLSPDRESLIYQRTETARLTVLDLKTGQLGVELSQLELYGGEVSATGVLAAPTAHGPWESNELCVLDVAAKL